ncbi:cytochrome C oxidase subunit IV family protein [Tundrisphaera sp. TA3]|uniref:cytochrome C oxidase subunit IV family protein n=1 Tax=Tundrisphaera sp. TA3 TaxID=3435775 RepID=UPI003EBA5F09
MIEPRNLTPEQERFVESHAPYMKVFYALLVFTVLEYLYARFLPLSFTMLVAGLMTMAIIKATLVGMYFMHLKFEGRWIYMILVPVCLLAIVVVLGLIPDMVLHENADQGPAGIAAPEVVKPA